MRFGSDRDARRSEDGPLLTGRGRFTDDVSVPGQAHAAFVRAQVGHAELRGVDPDGLWLRDPDGNLVNVRDEAPSVPPPDPPLRLNSPGHIGRQVERGAPESTATASPRRLGHVLLFTPDVERQLDFYTRVLGMKLSDRSKSIIAFLRCTTDHHNVAFLTSKGPGFHHGSFEVGSVDEIAMGALRMQERGFDYIPEACAWQPRDFPEADALYRWGPPVPDDFGLNREVEG